MIVYVSTRLQVPQVTHTSKFAPCFGGGHDSCTKTVFYSPIFKASLFLSQCGTNNMLRICILFFYCLQNETWNFRGRVSVGQMRVIHRNFPKNDRTRYTTKRNRVKRSNKNELQKIEGGDVVKPQKINNNVKASTPNQLAVGTPACVNKCSLRKLPNRYLFPLLHRFLLSRNSALLAFSMFSVFK